MNKRTVLIVDDEEINRIILGKILSRDYNLLYASNGRLAMKLLTENSNTISAVLLDIVMPEMDGYEVLEAMRSDRNLAKIPVIISSQRGDDETEIKALSLGAHDFIAKPYKNDIIRHRLANMIEFRETAALVNTARLDELTGLYNKTYFQKKARELILEHPDEKYNMFYLDIERFKVVNDTFGAQAGDNLLCHIAANLSEIVGENGICARFNADDFYIFNSSTEALREEELISLISGNRLLPHNMNVKLRCGIYEADDIALPVSVMCDRAQLAAETIKGKYDRYIAYYDDSLRRRILVEQEISEQMEGALRDGQFHVYYQPKYELCSGRIAGAEALVRWKHPEHGMIPPGKFIPLFEKNGFITTLDMYIWEKVCLDLVELRESGLSQVPVSVNVSRADIYDSSLTDTLTGLVEKYKIPCGLLHLEITESAYAEDPEHIISVVSRLREYGFTIEMDDFGSGYSSLNMLSEMPIDVLKLDTRFIQREATKAAGKGILSFIISLAKWLGLSVVAEGVENLEQIITLKTMDCDYVQGFYYAHPMPKADFFSLLASENNTERKNSVIGRNHGSQTKQSDSSEGIMLIVDDTEVNRALLVQTFSDRYEIVETENGVEGREYLHENAGRVAIVMLDLLMPVMDGFQVLKQIRSNELTRDLPVIVTSQGDGASEARA
ncbi:MAG: EAL domain-containing protein, partial [Eubacteriales bacterium]